MQIIFFASTLPFCDFQCLLLSWIPSEHVTIRSIFIIPLIDEHSSLDVLLKEKRKVGMKNAAFKNEIIPVLDF